VDCTAGGIAPSAHFIPGCLVVSSGLILGLSFRQSLVQSLFFLDEFSDFLGVDSVHQAHSWDISRVKCSP